MFSICSTLLSFVNENFHPTDLFTENWRFYDLGRSSHRSVTFSGTASQTIVWTIVPKANIDKNCPHRRRFHSEIENCDRSCRILLRVELKNKKRRRTTRKIRKKIHWNRIFHLSSSSFVFLMYLSSCFVLNIRLPSFNSLFFIVLSPSQTVNITFSFFNVWSDSNERTNVSKWNRVWLKQNFLFPVEWNWKLFSFQWMLLSDWLTHW